MSTYDDQPTRRLHRPADSAAAAPPTAPLPGPLSLHGGSAADATQEVGLEELFEAAPEASLAAAQPAPPVRAETASAEAPTWTAMPVVRARSHRAAAARKPARPLINPRLRADALAAWDGAVRRGHDWLGVQDNKLMTLTALVAIFLIVVVAVLGH